jgi:hypothetical protein
MKEVTQPERRKGISMGKERLEVERTREKNHETERFAEKQNRRLKPFPHGKIN